MNIFLIHLYYLLEDDKRPKIMRPCAPLGLFYMSSYLNKNKIENYVYNSKSFEYLYLQKKRIAKKYFHQGYPFSLV
jgi:anaerobic magnesium-protoporphyrin IX monomethyl ester cyclase